MPEVSLAEMFLAEQRYRAQTSNDGIWLDRMLMFLTNPMGDKTIEERQLRLRAAMDIVGDTFND
jgi:hypothetical protein